MADAARLPRQTFEGDDIVPLHLFRQAATAAGRLTGRLDGVDDASVPAIMTRQQPQAPWGAHPFLAETTPHSSRSTSSRCIPGSYEASVALPFSVK